MNVRKVLLWLFLTISILVLGYGIYYYYSIQSDQNVHVFQVEKKLKKQQKKNPAHSTATSEKKKHHSVNGIAVLTFRNASKKYHKKVAVNEGCDGSSLSNGAGWDTNTCRPNEEGNCVIYGHRDSSFAYLQSANIDDSILCTTQNDTILYEIISIRITKPTANSINDLAANNVVNEAILAQNQITNVNDQESGEAKTVLDHAKVLTLVTCHPFTFVGSSPNRCVVTALEVSKN